MPKLIFNFLYFDLRKHHFHRVHLNSLVINCIKGTGTSLVTVQQNNQGYKYLFQRQSAIFLLHGINHSGHRYGAERDQHKSIGMSGKPVKPQVLLRLGQQCHFGYERACYPQVSTSLQGLRGSWHGCRFASHCKLWIRMQ